MLEAPSPSKGEGVGGWGDFASRINFQGSSHQEGRQVALL